MSASAPYCVQLLDGLAQIDHLPAIFIRKMGRAWAPQACPPGITPGTKKQCYANAGILAMENPELTYVEGYACPPGLIPVNHAWCVDRQWRVVDNTFDDAAGAQYFGVPCSRGFLLSRISETGVWGLMGDCMTPELFIGFIDDVQAGTWAASPNVAAELKARFESYLKKVVR